MGLGDMAKKAKQALGSEKGEQVSDTVLDRGADLANRATGGKHADKVSRGRDAIDDRVGTEGATGTGAGTGRHRAPGEPDTGGTAREHRS